MENILLEFKNLVTEFHTEGTIVKAVNGVSFTLNKGETIGIVGESGSGKSVTSLSAMRLIPSPPGKISGGEIIFHEKDGTATNLLAISEVVFSILDICLEAARITAVKRSISSAGSAMKELDPTSIKQGQGLIHIPILLTSPLST